jgi:glycosyltransferase involved in cell wall biosynthesis
VKVLYLVSAYPRAPGDVITPWLVETVRRLSRRGVEAEILAPAYRGSGGGILDGVRVHRFRYAPAPLETLTHDRTAPDRIRANPFFLGLVPSYVGAMTRAATRLARTGDYDLMHAFWPIPHGLPGIRARRRTGVPLVSTFFGVELTWMRSDLPFLRPLLRRIVRQSDAVTAISSYTAGQLAREVPGTEPRIIPFGATVEPLSEPPPPFAHGGPARLLFAGRLVERKGVDRLLEAMAMLDPGIAELAIVGDGPERGPLEEEAARSGIGDRVRFRGFVPADELAAAYLHADAVVLPARRDSKGDVEGLGVVLIEGLACGRPVIGTRSGGIVDVVRDGETGVLVPSDDAPALADAIRRLAADREGAREMGRRGREDVAVRFGWERVVSDLEALYRQVGSR